jgi:hypothetical protein
MSQRRHRFDHDAYCAGVDAETATFASSIRGADPATPVPTCGSSSLRDLVGRCGHIHRWAAAIVGKLSARRLDRKAADWPLPPDPADHVAWLATGGRDLVEVLRADDPRVGVSGDRALLRYWVIHSAI